MEETFITHLRQELQRSDYGSKHGDIQIWYNEAGDCIQFKTTDHIATRGKRIDEYLTLYVAIEDEKPIGFQLKDVHALIKEYGTAGMVEVEAGYISADKRLVSITATTLILIAFNKRTDSKNRIHGYERALRTVPRELDSLKIPVT
ncbi:MAG: hypothetical protein A2060_03650 [Planctomycetes bacterium GWA2_50_13]|nr:MAG: hypothetical protein A2060_03650 [Planctomycetes bacterium GWA2_50_13]OHB92074.1 MAG: hypothetical protein A3E75_00285 [Planctomycetes bacterium RIFCSPHIGHO2_12_FULL_51_37]OHB96339.1 MAG: hypothetical protein A3I59_09145 [Planctomycetes bacterium RIFCSPLOWO2_02_FULL_50_16]OHC02390.1 MAG: hypothetical protein A3G17_04465 [Planctomycetes bacterium RIFCSPLOWO2_12_FULL_50_35]HCN19767.1 hypothetical protein [Planctomycetia bacterium]